MKKGGFLLVLLFCSGCSHQPKQLNIAISLADSNRLLKITGFDREVIAEIGSDTSSPVWQRLLPIYKMPADTDMKDYQNVQPGKYLVKDSIVFFTPDTLFKKSQAYFLRFYHYDKAADIWQYVRSKKRMGALNFTDLIFKY